ncbi:putative Tic20 family protein [Pseudonocardia parietis]|uniref:Tic20 family protein n=1 Tax=Pseudonocardia parietis TaxID=570936 RepID=A0ABS4VV84_9PSEU|nr:putative Tic20 family protein [Pseudonocardia parietis]
MLSAGLLSLLGPLLVWLVKKDDPFARRAAAGAFNFNLLFWALFLLSWLLIITVVGIIVAVPLMLVLFVVSAWCHIKGAVRASNNQTYDYPFQLRVLS